MVFLQKRKAENPRIRVAFPLTAGGILNAYREGDLTFQEAVDAIGRLKALFCDTPNQS